MLVDGCSAVVTGGGSGLGAATALHLASAGARVTVVDIDEDGGRRSASACGPCGQFVAGDVTSESDVRHAMEQAVQAGVLRVVVSCAGIGLPRRTLGRDGRAHAVGDFERVIRVNLLGTFNVLRLGAEAMAQSPPGIDGERGVVVNTASVAAFDGQIGQVSYAASKGAVVAMTLPAARDLADRGIRVCAIAPGLMDTPLFATLPAATVAGLTAAVAFPGRLGLPDEFAGLVGHIVANSYLNGEVVRLDGGLRMTAG